jgi:hypothetical protein
VPDKAVISHRGEKYEIGRGKRFYGIWVVGAPYEAPVDRWPENRDGWQQAWARFASIEVPGTITASPSGRKGGAARQRLAGLLRAVPSGRGRPDEDGQPGRARGGAALLIGEMLLVLGVVLGLAGLFPAYEGGQSLLSQANLVVPHLAYVLGWALTAALVALSVARPSNAARLGALFGLGISAVTLGLFIADLGEVVSAGASLGSGLVVSLAGWLACTAGAALALAARLPRPDGPGPRAPWQRSGLARPGRAHVGPLVLLVLAGIGAAVAFAPSWDSYTLTAAAQGTSQTVTAGNAFDSPAMVVAGNVLVMVAVVAVAVVAALWRPARQGGLLLAGAVVVLAGEAVSALIQAGQQASPALFGISSAQASALGLSISSGLTASFWVFLVFVISLLVSCAWLFTEPAHPAVPAFPGSPWLPPGGDQRTTEAAGGVAREGADTRDPAQEDTARDGAVREDNDSDQSSQDRDVSDNADSRATDSGRRESPADTWPAQSGSVDSRQADTPAADSTAESEGGGQSTYA